MPGSVSPENKALVVAIVLTTLVFAIDLMVPLGVAVGVLYVLCQALLYRSGTAAIVLIAAIASAATLLVMLTTLDAETSWKVYANRGISLLAIWINAALLIYNVRQRRHHDALRDAYEVELAARNDELEQFAYIASHDLQEPLRTIRSFAGVLTDDYRGKLDEHADKCLQFLSDATERMSLLVRDLLEYARVGKGLEKGPVDCNALLAAVCNDLGALAEERGATIEYGQLPVLQGYEAALRSLFLNLITNGIKFADPDRPAVIRVDAEQDESGCLLSVTDNGIGIDVQHRERIFHAFQRLHGRMDYSGSGIGLAQCRKTAELHGGRIWADAAASGTGSTFYVLIPDEENPGQ